MYDNDYDMGPFFLCFVVLRCYARVSFRYAISWRLGMDQLLEAEWALGVLADTCSKYGPWHLRGWTVSLCLFFMVRN